MKLTDEEIIIALRNGCGIKRKNWQLIDEINYDNELGFDLVSIRLDDLRADDWEVSDWGRTE